MNLNELIEYFEDKQKRYLDLMPISKKVTDAVLKELKGKKSLLGKLNDDMTEKKWCYRYGMWVVEQCEVCESCLKAENLQWNEGDE
jgi:CHAD domain-containing protein